MLTSIFEMNFRLVEGKCACLCIFDKVNTDYYITEKKLPSSRRDEGDLIEWHWREVRCRRCSYQFKV